MPDGLFVVVLFLHEVRLRRARWRLGRPRHSVVKEGRALPQITGSVQLVRRSPPQVTARWLSRVPGPEGSSSSRCAQNAQAASREGAMYGVHRTAVSSAVAGSHIARVRCTYSTSSPSLLLLMKVIRMNEDGGATCLVCDLRRGYLSMFCIAPEVSKVAQTNFH